MQSTPIRITLLVVFVLALLLAVYWSVNAARQAESNSQAIFPGSNIERGKRALIDYGCASCHYVPGVREADGMVGPPLSFWADRKYIAGRIANTPNNLVSWIMAPQAIEPGTAMPDMGVTWGDARDIAAYLYTLRFEQQSFTGSRE